ncbi:MAG TPA: hypothetical protein VIR78_00490 [Malonomonas sp.]
MNHSFVAILLLILCSCTYMASPPPIEPGAVLEFQSDSVINITNAQTVEDRQIVNFPMKVNLKEATESAITLLKPELDRHGVILCDSAEKELALSLVELSFRTDIVPTECQATFLAESKTGLSRKIKGHQDLAMKGLKTACNHAITAAATKILNDRAIRGFIDPALENSGQTDEIEQVITAPPIVRVPFKKLVLPAELQNAHFEYSVRLAQPAEMETLEQMRSTSKKLLGASLGISAVSVAEAFLIPSFFSGSLIAGAIFITPLAISVSAVEHHQLNTIETVLEQTDLVKLTRQNVATLCESTDSRQDSQTLLVELIITSYGLTKEPACLSADAAIVVTTGDQLLFQEFIYIEPYLRSEDVPAPVCATVDLFAADNGKLIRQGLTDYAQILAAIFLQRTGGQR